MMHSHFRTIFSQDTHSNSEKYLTTSKQLCAKKNFVGFAKENYLARKL